MLNTQKKRVAVFCYGTLKAGNYNDIRRYDSLAEYYGQGVLHDYSLEDLGGYPAIFPKKGAFVRGEVWRIREEDLGAVDALESGYCKATGNIKLPRETIEAVYYYFKEKRTNNEEKNEWHVKGGILE